MKAHDIRRPGGRKRRRTKRRGRGDCSGQGGTSGRGHKGQKARAGGYHKVGFEGGQMPLSRRVPKRGFTNIFRRSYAVINVDQLSRAFPDGGEITLEGLQKRGLVKKPFDGLKILGRGETAQAFTIRAHRISSNARAKIEAAGGSVEVISG